MKFIKNDTSGLYVVTIGGVRWNNCTVDADCPGSAICSGASWQQDPKTCICNMNQLTGGADCTEITSVGLAETIYYSLLTASLAMLSCFAIFLSYKLHRVKGTRVDASTVSLWLASVGALFEAALCGTLAVAPHKLYPLDPITGKKETRNIALYVFLPVVFITTTLAAMNISLVWVRITNNALRMKQNATVDFISYRRVVFLYYIIVTSGICVSLAIRQVYWVVVIVMFGIVILGLTYTVAAYKVNSLIKSFSSTPHSPENTGEASGSVRHSSKLSKNSKDATPVMEPIDKPATPAEENRSTTGNKVKRGFHISVPKYRNPLFKAEKGDNMKVALRDIRILALRMMFTTYLYFTALTIYLFGGGTNVLPATVIVRARVGFAWVWFENFVLLGLVIWYLKDVAHRKLDKTSSTDNAGGDVIVPATVQGSTYNGTAIISSNKASKEEM